MGLGISVLSSKALSVVVENLFRKMNLTDAYSTEYATKFAEETIKWGYGEGKELITREEGNSKTVQDPVDKNTDSPSSETRNNETPDNNQTPNEPPSNGTESTPSEPQVTEPEPTPSENQSDKHISTKNEKLSQGRGVGDSGLVDTEVVY